MAFSPHAARTVARKRSTWAARCSDWRDSSEAAPSTWLAAAPVPSAAPATPAMVLVTSPVPCAAWPTFLTISCVAAPCCSTAAAMLVATPLISWIRAVMPPIAVTAWPVEVWICAIWPEISLVAFAVCSAKAFTSDATTAKPLPAAPARAGPRRLDRGVERQEVGLPGNRRDQPDDVADARHRAFRYAALDGIETRCLRRDNSRPLGQEDLSSWLDPNHVGAGHLRAAALNLKLMVRGKGHFLPTNIEA